MSMKLRSFGPGLALCVSWTLFACGSTDDPVDPDNDEPVQECALDPDDDAPEFVKEIGCAKDFRMMASVPADASIPGARSVKSIVDRVDDDALYFQNSKQYSIHWEFVSEHLSGGDLPVVPMLSEFNTTEYYSPNRRFILGALTHYEGPDRYCYEIAPYDAATPEMVETAYNKIKEATYLGDDLCFHPTSQLVESSVKDTELNLVTTDELFADIDYQPLNFAESYGKLKFTSAKDLETEYVTFRDIVVLDAVPNDISVTLGIITADFQTPLSHINVLSQNRGIPNMALRNAFEDDELRDLDGKWVRLKVGASDYEIEEVDKAEADAWWDENKPGEVQVPGMDLDVTDLRDITETVDVEAHDGDLLAAIKAGTRAFGGKAANYGVLASIEDVPVPKAFSIPVFYYMQFMEQNGFDKRVEELLDDPDFQDSADVRDEALAKLREDMMSAPVDPDFEEMLMAKLDAEYKGIRMRFRSSTNAEDLDGFTGAGLYTSKSAEPGSDDLVLDAIREVWASVWFFRAFEERSYRSIDHTAVGMALLVHNSFPDEEANGVALTNNPFDRSNLEPAFYINVQLGEASVVHPPVGVSTDQYLHYFDSPGQPISYISHSNLIEEGTTVITTKQAHELGQALDKIRKKFAPAYAPDKAGAWWAMDVEFKFDGEPGETPALFVKQARPYGNR